MRRDGTNHTRDFHSLVCAYGYPVVEHRLIPPAANGGKTQKTALVDVGDHKADFIHMPDNGNFWTFIPLTGNKAAQTIKGDLINARFQRVYQNVANFLFIAADGAGFAQLLQ